MHTWRIVTLRLATQSIRTSHRFWKRLQLGFWKIGRAPVSLAVSRRCLLRKFSLAKKNIPENLISSHKPVPLVKTLYVREQKKQYARRLSSRILNDREKQKMLQNYRYKLRCRVCGEKASTFCGACSKDSPDSTRGFLVLCGPIASVHAISDAAMNVLRERKKAPNLFLFCVSFPLHYLFTLLFPFFSTRSFSLVLSLRFCNTDKYNFGMLYCSVVIVQCALHCVCERPTACIVLKVAFQIERPEQ